MGFADIFVWEMLGTATLILLGVGVVANVNLNKALGFGGGWLLVAFGWGFAVFVGASVADASGGHINPAVTLGQAIAGNTPWDAVPAYWIAQFVGAFIGAVLAWVVYKLQFDAHDKPQDTLGIFSTGPTVDNKLWNTATEVIATYILLIWILLSPGASEGPDGSVFGNAALGYAGVAFLVVAIGASLGGPTGYAINPARDLGPRIAYAVLPIKGKGTPNWQYAWVPIVGPLIGAALAALTYLALPV
ncbi:MIP/aquaporin family protein [Actinoalloteichus hymeniacidonis]|uniref:Permease, glycerol uptake facilitator n=1 Tax=Actinoalloteichus hymeniacidonis TaxID=340345 RepID=A0AAC9HU58_9PSEU|nr:MIP/aquaporin family protein [Actinoalloteichus hymeniacidonis]AOS65538.1 permease, glycerol uptake facilitator [Actinoalloteichus hymeniacidonis]MBB5906374.1 glycerol uptake facilitator protein [Actinoalloteichus hymeniacidonis]